MTTKQSAKANISGDGHGHDEVEGPLPNGLNYEVRDARVRPIMITGIVLSVIVVIAFILVWGMLYLLGPGQSTNTLSPTVLVETPVLPPGPLLEQFPGRDGDRVIAEQTEQLTSYGWLDQVAGTVHIPIDHAVDLLVERGLPTAEPTTAPTADPNATPQPTADPNATPQPTAEPNTTAPTADPNTTEQPAATPVP